MSQVIKYPLTTEKAIRLMESENKLIFIVDKKAKKLQIKTELETMFKARVDSVNTHIRSGQKRAYVKFNNETPAIDIATKLGVI